MSELRQYRSTIFCGAAFGLMISGLVACSGGGGGGGATEPDMDEDPPPPDPPMTVVAPTATVLEAQDLDNLGDARDLNVVVLLPVDDDGVVAEYRVFLVPTGANAGFDVEAAAAVGSTSFVSLDPDPGPLPVDLPSSLRASDGTALANGQSYQVRVLSVGSGENVENALSNGLPVALEVTNLVRTLVPSIQGGSGGMETDAAGNIYFSDFGPSLVTGPPGSQVWLITPQGEASVFATGFVGASGNAFDSQGVFYQSNIGGNTISRVTSAGVVSTYVSQGVVSPVGIVFDAGDTLYVANCGNNTIQKVTPDGASTQFASSGLFACPNGIALASDGNLYVANFGNGDVIRVTPDGTASRLTTLPGGNNGHLLWGNGVLYVVARAANQIYKVTLDGEQTLLAGTGTRGLDDGPALSATLSLTNDVALSPDGGILYFNDVAQVLPGDNNTLSPVAIRMVVLDADGTGN